MAWRTSPVFCSTVANSCSSIESTLAALAATVIIFVAASAASEVFTSGATMLGTHLILSAYGFWLPNDPRGSWSNCVWSQQLYDQFGPSTKTEERRSLAHDPHDRERRVAAKSLLKYPPVQFTPEQTLLIAAGFADYASRYQIAVLACAIMPQHAHMVIAPTAITVDVYSVQFKAAATNFIKASGNPLIPRSS